MNKTYIISAACIGMLLTLSQLAWSACAGGVYQGIYVVRTCETASPICSYFYNSQTWDQYCGVWCCPSGTAEYSGCTNRVKNGCCLLADTGTARVIGLECPL
jgi:hypothetical protein